MMDNRPDSALVLLDSMASCGLSSREDCARYALLRSQALDKSYIDVKDDSLIKVAVNYYSARRDSREKMLSYYYLARVYYNKEDYMSSMRSALLARKIAGQLGDYYYSGLACQAICDIYNVTRNVREELRWIDMAIEAYKAAHKPSHLNWAYYEKAVALNNALKFDEGKRLVDSLYCNLPVEGYDLLRKKCCKYYVKHYARTSDGTNKDSIWQYYDKMNPSERGISLAQYYFRLGEYDSLANELALLKNASRNGYDSLFHDYYSAWLSFKLGKQDEAFELLNSVLFKMDTLVFSFHTLGVSSYQSDFYLTMAQDEVQRSGDERKNWILAVTALVIVCVVMCYAYHERMTRKAVEMDLMIKTIEQLNKEVAEQERISKDARVLIGDLFRHQFNTLEQLCQTYYSLTSRDNEKEKVVSRIKPVMEQFTTAGNLERLEASINRSFNNLLQRLHDSGIKLGTKEKTLLLLSLAGFSNHASTYLLNTQLSNYYNLKSRLKGKLMTLEPCLRDEILGLMGW